jgi:hypothetical protein
LSGIEDPDVLEWAALNGRIVLTQDIKTMPGFALGRVRAGLAMPGVICVPQAMGIGPAIADLVIVMLCGIPADFDSNIKYLPL